MNRYLSLLLLSLLVLTSHHRTALSAEKASRSRIGSSPDMSKPVTINASSLDLDEFIAELSRTTQVPMEVSNDIRTVKVTARLTGKPLGTVLHSLQQLFGFTSRYYAASEKYKLGAGDYWERKEAKEQESLQLLKDRFAFMQDSLKKAKNIDVPINVIERLAANFKEGEVETLFKNRRLEIPFPRLSAMDQEGWKQSFYYGQTYTNGKPDVLTEEDLQVVKITYLIEGEGDNLRILGGRFFPRESRFKGFGLYAALLLSINDMKNDHRNGAIYRPSLRATHVNFFDLKTQEERNKHPRPEHYQSEPAEIEDRVKAKPRLRLEPAKNGGSTTVANDPLLSRKITLGPVEALTEDRLTGEYNRPLTTMDVVLHNAAQQGRFDFLSDSFLSEPFALAPMKDQPLEAALDTIAGARRYLWGRSGPLFLFRNSGWSSEGETEVSAKSVRRWLQYWHPRRGLDQPLKINEVAMLSSLFSLDGLSQVGRINNLAQRIHRAAGPFAVYASLTGARKEQMGTEGGIKWTQLSPSEQQILLERVPVEVRKRVVDRIQADPDSRFRIHVVKDYIFSEFTTQGEWKRDITLPVQWMKVMQDRKPMPQIGEVDTSGKPAAPALPLLNGMPNP
ncbi:MAG: hypothetical protein KY468_00680 [Armatimonadetes bacterium]|nr:hypothetical protein [Armatimonadota bacterium]